jgi:hypothetical protein
MQVLMTASKQSHDVPDSMKLLWNVSASFEKLEGKWDKHAKTAAGCWLFSLDSCGAEKEVPKLQYKTSETMTQFPQKGCVYFSNLFCCLQNQKLNFGCGVKQAPWKSYPACTFEGSIILPVLMASTIGWPRCGIVLQYCITPTYVPE